MKEKEDIRYSRRYKKTRIRNRTIKKTVIMMGKRKLLPDALGSKGATARKLCSISIQIILNISIKK
jgi:hypothetical protein